MTKYYKSRLNTAKKVEDKLKAMAGTYRKVFNTAMEKQWDILALSKGGSKYITGTQLMNDLKKLRRKEFPFIKKMDGGILTSAAFRANESFRRWFENYTPESFRRPRFLSRKKDLMSFKTEGNVRIFNDYIEVPKLGKIKLFEKGYFPQEKVISNVTFSYDGNYWWLSLEVREKEELPSNADYVGEAILDMTVDGDIILDGKVLPSPVSTQTYKRAEKKKKSLERKLKRQSLANIVVNDKGYAKTRTSKNMMKTRKQLAKVTGRLANIRKDGFKKQACEVARTKLQKLHCLSSLSIKQNRQGGLTRKAREKHSLDFLNMIRKRVELEGTEILSHTVLPNILTPQALGSGCLTEASLSIHSEERRLVEAGIVKATKSSRRRHVSNRETLISSN